jgi:hypothetical protein
VLDFAHARGRSKLFGCYLSGRRKLFGCYLSIKYLEMASVTPVSSYLRARACSHMYPKGTRVDKDSGIVVRNDLLLVRAIVIRQDMEKGILCPRERDEQLLLGFWSHVVEVEQTMSLKTPQVLLWVVAGCGQLIC